MDRGLRVALRPGLCSNISSARALESTVESTIAVSNCDCIYLMTGWGRAAMAIARRDLQATR